MVAVARAAGGAPALRELAVAGTEQGTQAMVEFALALERSATLRRLDLSSPVLFSIEGEVYEHLARALLRNTSLEHLVLARAGVRDHGAMWLADAVARTDRLVSLDLSGNRVAARGLACLADALCTVTCLRRLDLSGNRVTDAAADDLHRAIRQNASLVELGLADTGLGEEGLTAVGEALRHNRTLQHLSLRGNSFDGVSRDVFRALLAPLVGDGVAASAPHTALTMQADRVDYLPLIM
jgi:Ran GTPase-activating protein (RanGAP) involved in mRNA processing and transport